MERETRGTVANLVYSWGLKGSNRDEELIASDVYQVYQSGIEEGRDRMREQIRNETSHPVMAESEWFEVRPELVVNLAGATRLTMFPEGAKEGTVKLLLWHGATDTMLMDFAPIAEIVPMRDEILRRLGVQPPFPEPMPVKPEAPTDVLKASL